MKRHNTQKINDIISSIFQDEPALGIKYFEYKIINSFFDVAGEDLRSYINGMKIVNRVLLIEVSSSILRNELMMGRETLAEKLNAFVERDAIDSIVYK